MKYRVVYTRTEVAEYFVEADSVDDAEKDFEERGIDGELFFIEDEGGKQQVIFD